MPEDLQLSAKSVASIWAHVFGPSWYDGPHYGWGTITARGISDLSRIYGPHPEPWALGPQPEPWRRISLATAIADAHIQNILSLDRAASLMGDAVSRSAQEQMRNVLQEIDDLCPPMWPHWPKGWPPPPRHHWEDEEMTLPELFSFGIRVLGAASVAQLGEFQEGLASLGNKIVSASMAQG